MKRIITLFTALCAMGIAFAQGSTQDEDITMVAFEEDEHTIYATISLKNNTANEIKEVCFQITYLDMSGNELDYADFKEKVSIEAGKTKRIQIRDFEGSKYYYYKSKRDFDAKPFKIQFKLKSYKTKAEAGRKSNVQVDEQSGTPTDKMINPFIIYSILLIYLGLFGVVAVMAKRRNRSVLAFTILSLIATPVLVIIVLLGAGKNEKFHPYR